MNASTRPLALVTGASSGIGADLARELAKDGHDLVLTARRTEPMNKLAEELKGHGAKIAVIASDLSKPGAAATLVADLDARGLTIDVLVNNAGLGDNNLFHEEDQARIGEMLQVNMVALTELTRLLLPGMVSRRKGGLILVASTAAFQPGPFMAVYCATKAYVLSLGDAIGFELKDTGVSVTVLCPGATTTEFSKVANTDTMMLFKSSMIQRMTSAAVARQGYEAFKAKRAVIITGAFNKIAAFTTRLSPRGMVVRLTGRLLKRTA